MRCWLPGSRWHPLKRLTFGWNPDVQWQACWLLPVWLTKGKVMYNSRIQAWIHRIQDDLPHGARREGIIIWGSSGSCFAALIGTACPFFFTQFLIEVRSTWKNWYGWQKWTAWTMQKKALRVSGWDAGDDFKGRVRISAHRAMALGNGGPPGIKGFHLSLCSYPSPVVTNKLKISVMSG